MHREKSASCRPFTVKDFRREMGATYGAEGKDWKKAAAAWMDVSGTTLWRWLDGQGLPDGPAAAGIRALCAEYRRLHRTPNQQQSLIAARRVLVIEDEYLLALEIEHQLCEMGAEVVMAGHPEEIDTAIRDQTIDFALSDISLGRTREGRDIYSWPWVEQLCQRGVPVLLTTGYSSAGQGAIPTPTKLPPLPRIIKPFGSEELIGVLTTLLSGRLRQSGPEAPQSDPAAPASSS